MFSLCDSLCCAGPVCVVVFYFSTVCTHWGLRLCGSFLIPLGACACVRPRDRARRSRGCWLGGVCTVNHVCVRVRPLFDHSHTRGGVWDVAIIVNIGHSDAGTGQCFHGSGTG